MTVIVSILCSDGVVVASDSMLSNFSGQIGTTETKGKKVFNLDNNHIFAFAGNPALAYRARIVIGHVTGKIRLSNNIPLDYSTNITANLINHFTATSLTLPLNLTFTLGFEFKGQQQCVVFDDRMQPSLLDRDDYWRCSGSGKQFADPFLKFLTDIFCASEQPSVRDAKWLAVWAVAHTIDTNLGGVNGPIQMTVLHKQDGEYVLENLNENELAEQEQSVESAKEHLLKWKQLINGDATSTDSAVEAMPTVRVPSASV